VGLRVKIGRLVAFGGLCAAATGVACSPAGNTTYPFPPPACVAPACVQLRSAEQTVALPSVKGVAVSTAVAGKGYVSIRDSRSPLDGSPPLPTAPILYARITAIYGASVLSAVPGFKLVFAKVPTGTLRLAALDDGVWTTVGNRGIVHGTTVKIAAAVAHPRIALADGSSYDLAVYAGGILPSPTPSPSPSPSPTPTHKPTPTPTPTPTPSSSPTPTPSPSTSPSPSSTPGLMTVAVVCAASSDACVNGSTSKAGSVQFANTGDTATLKPHETGPATTFTLKSDTCNKADDPSATGNWATLSPRPGTTASVYTVTSKNGGSKANPAICQAVVTDASGQTVTVDIAVTASNIGINAR
jgi:hypothetical protein